MINHESWRKVPAKVVLDYADEVGDEQAAAEFYIRGHRIKELRMNPSEIVKVKGYTHPEKLKILARADEVGDEQAADEFNSSTHSIARWRRQFKISNGVAKPKAAAKQEVMTEPVVEAIPETKNAAKLAAIAETFEESSNSELRQKLILENKILKERLEVATRQLNAMKSAISSLL